MLTRDDVNNLAGLARLDLTEAEADKLGQDMDSILGYIDELKKAPMASEEHQSDNYHLKNVMREDEGAFESGSFTNEILEEAPRQRNGYFAVKKILDN